MTLSQIPGVNAQHVQADLTPGAIDPAEVRAVQEAWGAGVLAIGAAHVQGGWAAALAVLEDFIDEFYGYSAGLVLFNPTLSSGEQTFRCTREGAMSYFMGGNPAFPLDQGFALMGWDRVEIQNVAVRIEDRTAMAMGKARFSKQTGEQVVVDKTWVFARHGTDRLHIVLHHSALPYEPSI